MELSTLDHSDVELQGLVEELCEEMPFGGGPGGTGLSRNPAAFI